MESRVRVEAEVGGAIGSEGGGGLGGGGKGSSGAPDLSLALGGVIQQAERVGHDLWLLYIDLATFFPGINRKALHAAELLAGVPKQVRELVAMIYGEMVGECEVGSTTCRYDSAAGLGDPFKNWMGALMGCVLSPDRAKIFLNTVLIALELVTRGVRLYGYGRKGRTRTWRVIYELIAKRPWDGFGE